MVVYKVSVTEDYEPLMTLFIRNELEFSEEEPIPTDLIKAWKVTTGEENKLIGGIALSRREGEFIIDGIAIDPDYRKHKIGKILLEKAVEEARSLGGNKILLVARAPRFFEKAGFQTIDEMEAPIFFECKTCPQYGVNCHPEIMKLEI